MPAVRVIIPTWNRSDLMQAAVRSVLAQTWRDLEVVVVDDGSTDDTAAVLREMSHQDPRVRPVRQDNAGPAAARNRALCEPGDFQFVGLIDSDDRWLPDHLERAMALFHAAADVGVVFGRSKVEDHTGSYDRARIQQREDVTAAVRCVTRHVGEATVLDPVRFLRVVLRDEFYPHPSTVVLRRQAIRHAPWFDESIYGWEDVDLYLSCASTGVVFAFDDAPHALVGFQADNVTGCADFASPRTLRNWSSILKVNRRKTALARDAGDRAVTREMVGHWAYLVGQAQAEQGLTAAARRSYLEALLSRPRLALRGLAATMLRRRRNLGAPALPGPTGGEAHT